MSAHDDDALLKKADALLKEAGELFAICNYSEQAEYSRTSETHKSSSLDHKKSLFEAKIISYENCEAVSSPILASSGDNIHIIFTMPKERFRQLDSNSLECALNDFRNRTSIFPTHSCVDKTSDFSQRDTEFPIMFKSMENLEKIINILDTDNSSEIMTSYSQDITKDFEYRDKQLSRKIGMKITDSESVKSKYCTEYMQDNVNSFVSEVETYQTALKNSEDEITAVHDSSTPDHAETHYLKVDTEEVKGMDSESIKSNCKESMQDNAECIVSEVETYQKALKNSEDENTAVHESLSPDYPETHYGKVDTEEVLDISLVTDISENSKSHETARRDNEICDNGSFNIETSTENFAYSQLKYSPYNKVDSFGINSEPPEESLPLDKGCPTKEVSELSEENCKNTESSAKKTILNGLDKYVDEIFNSRDIHFGSLYFSDGDHTVTAVHESSAPDHSVTHYEKVDTEEVLNINYVTDDSENSLSHERAIKYNEIVDNGNFNIETSNENFAYYHLKSSHYNKVDSFGSNSEPPEESLPLDKGCTTKEVSELSEENSKNTESSAKKTILNGLDKHVDEIFNSRDIHFGSSDFSDGDHSTNTIFLISSGEPTFYSMKSVCSQVTHFNQSEKEFVDLGSDSFNQATVGSSFKETKDFVQGPQIFRLRIEDESSLKEQDAKEAQNKSFKNKPEDTLRKQNMSNGRMFDKGFSPESKCLDQKQAKAETSSVSVCNVKEDQTKSTKTEIDKNSQSMKIVPENGEKLTFYISTALEREKLNKSGERSGVVPKIIVQEHGYHEKMPSDFARSTYLRTDEESKQCGIFTKDIDMNFIDEVKNKTRKNALQNSLVSDDKNSDFDEQESNADEVSKDEGDEIDCAPTRVRQVEPHIPFVDWDEWESPFSRHKKFTNAFFDEVDKKSSKNTLQNSLQSDDKNSDFDEQESVTNNASRNEEDEIDCAPTRVRKLEPHIPVVEWDEPETPFSRNEKVSNSVIVSGSKPISRIPYLRRSFRSRSFESISSLSFPLTKTSDKQEGKETDSAEKKKKRLSFSGIVSKKDIKSAVVNSTWEITKAIIVSPESSPMSKRRANSEVGTRPRTLSRSKLRASMDFVRKHTKRGSKVKDEH